MTTAPDLRECGHCGAPAAFGTCRDGATAYCTKCGSTMTAFHPNAVEAVADKWNRRYIAYVPGEVTDLIARLEESHRKELTPLHNFVRRGAAAGVMP